MTPSDLLPIANHLWQSTLFAGVAGLLTLLLRKNRACIRYSLWLAASVKFLVPFSLLVLAGSHFQRDTSVKPAASPLPLIIEQVNEPFGTDLLLNPSPKGPPSQSANLVIPLLSALWASGSLALLFSWWLRWRRMHGLLRAASPLPLEIGVPVLSSASIFEPGVFGVFRQVLLLPEGISSHLAPAELQAILAHELCHIRRRDNLATTTHMVVEALFWFHPLVWWIGARLMEERERACDEEVLQRGSESAAYAEGILKICELYLRSPLKCVSGVTGANLKQRIEAIMSNRAVLHLSLPKKAGLAITGVLAITVPVILGVTDAPSLRAQAQVDSNRAALPSGPASRAKFEVSSIRPAAPARAIPGGAGKGAPAAPPPGGPECAAVGRSTIDAGRVDFVCVSMRHLLLEAFAVPPGQLLAPDWTDTVAFDISAKLPNGATQDQLPEMFQSLLDDRFGLAFHRGTKEGAVNALVVAKGGLKVKPAAPDSAQPSWVAAARAMKGPYGFGANGSRTISMPDSNGSPGVVYQSPSMGLVRRSDTGGPGGIIHYDAPGITFEGLAQLAKIAGLGMDPSVGVVDMTGLKGRYQVKLDVSVADVITAITTGPRDPAFAQGAWLNVVQDGLKKLGLQLEMRKAPVEVIMIDHLEKTPTAN